MTRRRTVFHHIYSKPYGAFDIYSQVASIAFRAVNANPRGKIVVRWLVSPTRMNVDGCTYRGKRGKDSGCIVMKIPADMHGLYVSDTAHNLAIVIGTLAHELSHVWDNQKKVRHVCKPTKDLHGTPAERRADYEEHRTLRMLATHPQLRSKFVRLAKRLHKKGLIRK